MPIMASLVYNQDVLTNDVDKTFTVPAGKCWKLLALQAKLDTNNSVVVGNRQLRVEIRDGTNVIWFKNFGAVQVLDTTRYYYSAADLPDDVDFDGSGNIRMWKISLTIPPGWTVRLYESAAIDAAVDDLEYRLLVEEFIP